MIGIVQINGSPPAGTYRGTWSGYTITVDGHPGVTLETDEGCRSLSGASVTVVVSVDGTASAEEAQ